MELVNFYPKFEKVASFYPNTLEDKEDLVQDMILTCLEKQAKDPSFMDQTESYIVHGARLKLWNHLRNKATFDRYQFWATEDENGDNCLDFVADSNLTPEEALIQKQDVESIVAALETLSEKESQVIELVVAGVSTGEIAKMLEVTPAAVSCYKKRAINKLAVK